MGNQLNQYKFNPLDWTEARHISGNKVWQNKTNPNRRLLQFRRYSNDQKDFENHKKMFILRKNHPQLVASQFLNVISAKDMCADSYQHSTYIQEIPLTLADVYQIPYPDYLHMYYQCLKGFQILKDYINCFVVEEDFIGITGQGVVKVWLSQDVSRIHPFGKKIEQEQMVKNIIQIIDDNIDHANHPEVFSVKKFIYQSGTALNFKQAFIKLEQYVRIHHKGIIPNRLECINQYGGAYFISKKQRQKSQFDLPSNQKDSQNIRIPAFNKNNQQSSLNNIYFSSTDLGQNQYIKKNQTPEFQPIPRQHNSFLNGQRSKSHKLISFVPNSNNIQNKQTKIQGIKPQSIYLSTIFQKNQQQNTRNNVQNDKNIYFKHSKELGLENSNKKSIVFSENKQNQSKKIEIKIEANNAQLK